MLRFPPPYVDILVRSTAAKRPRRQSTPDHTQDVSYTRSPRNLRRGASEGERGRGNGCRTISSSSDQCAFRLLARHRRPALLVMIVESSSLADPMLCMFTHELYMRVVVLTRRLIFSISFQFKRMHTPQHCAKGPLHHLTIRVHKTISKHNNTTAQQTSHKQTYYKTNINNGKPTNLTVGYVFCAASRAALDSEAAGSTPDRVSNNKGN